MKVHECEKIAHFGDTYVPDMTFRVCGDVLAVTERYEFPSGVEKAVLVVRLFQPLPQDLRCLLRLSHGHVQPLQAAHEALTVRLPRCGLCMHLRIHFLPDVFQK